MTYREAIAAGWSFEIWHDPANMDCLYGQATRLQVDESDGVIDFNTQAHLIQTVEKFAYAANFSAPGHAAAQLVRELLTDIECGWTRQISFPVGKPS